MSENTEFSLFDNDEGEFFKDSSPISASDSPDSSSTKPSDQANVTSEKITSTIEVKSDMPSKTPPLDEDIDEIPQLRGEDFADAYVAMVKRIQNQYCLLPKLNHDEIYAELRDLSVKCCPTPTLQSLNEEIQKVQAAKDRLAEIYADVVRNYSLKKRAVDVMRDSWGKFTDEKNADKRKGDSIFRLSNFEIDFARTEALLKVASHIVKNLDSLHDGLSRRITIYQLLLKLHDVGRGGLPDFDFDKTFSAESDDDKENTGEIDLKEGLKPKEESF